MDEVTDAAAFLFHCSFLHCALTCSATCRRAAVAATDISCLRALAETIVGWIFLFWTLVDIHEIWS